MPNLNDNATEAELMMCIAYVEPVSICALYSQTHWRS